MEEVTKIFVTWADYQDMAKEIAEEYKDKELTKIVGLSRGGLVLGVHLSNLLNVPFEPLEWQTRDGDAQDVTRLLRIEKNNDLEKVLFVDDMCDSGKTIDQINSIVKGINWAVLINKLPTKVQFEAEILLGDEWIVFPWEY